MRRHRVATLGLLVILGGLVSGGCKNETTEVIPPKEGPGARTVILKVAGTVGEMRIETIQVDGCDYLVIAGPNRFSVTHKGNCRGCLERRGVR